MAWFEPDLGDRLTYARGLVILTDRRVLTAATNGPADLSPRAWALDSDTRLRCEERGGVGTLELTGPSGRLAHWRYTAGRGRDAEQLVQRLDSLRSALAGLPLASRETVCPSCGAVIRRRTAPARLALPPWRPRPCRPCSG